MHTTTLPAPQRFDVAERPRRPRGWAYAGLLGGIGSFLFFLGRATMLSTSTDALADNADVLAEVEGKAGWVWAFQTSGIALAVLLAIFAVGLRRRLASQEPAGSLVPDLAGLGLILMSIMTLVGTGISTEMFHALRNAATHRPASGAEREDRAQQPVDGAHQARCRRPRGGNRQSA